MARLGVAALICVLAACPAGGGAGAGAAGPQPPRAAGGPCPGAAGLYEASYATQEDGKGRTGWVLPLHAMTVDAARSKSVPAYAPIDATTAGVSGVPAVPSGTAWLVTEDAAPCRVKLGSYYEAKLPGPPPAIAYGVELDGCPAPRDPRGGDGLVMFTPQAPGGCQLAAPRPVAARLGTMDAQRRWHRPARGTPIPAALAALVPRHACQAPSCEKLWSIGEVARGGQPVAWSGAVNWLSTDASTAPCTWKAARWSGFFVRGPAGRPVKVPEIHGHPFVLSAVLSDRRGPRALLAEGPGAFATYDLVPGGARLAHAITWLAVPASAWRMVDHLGPICPAPRAKPAPMPRDAKPISPY